MNKPKSVPRPPAPPVYQPSRPQMPVQGLGQGKVAQKTPLLPPPVYRPNPVTPGRIFPQPKQPLALQRVQPPSLLQPKSGVQQKSAPARLASPRPLFPPPPYRPTVVQRAAAESKEIKAPLAGGVGLRALVAVGKSLWGDCRDLLTSIKGDLTMASQIAERYKSRTSTVIGVVSKAAGYADTATHLFPPAKLVTTPLKYAVNVAKALTTIKDLVDLLGKNPIEGVPLLLVDHLQQLHGALENAVLSLEGLESDDKLFDVLDDIQAGIEKVKVWVDQASTS
jgi:hypothetical protein